MRRSWKPIFGGFVPLMSTSKPVNMKVRLGLSSKIEQIFDFACGFFFEKKATSGGGNDLAL